MGYFSQPSMNVEELLFEGATVPQIAAKLNLSEAQVLQYIEDLEAADRDPGEYDDSMDGDFDSAMASAGWGTDEDYGYYGDE